MIRSNAFDYISLMDKAADASWLRETTISNNIANVDTPGYKRKDVKFSDILSDQLTTTRYNNLDQAVSALDYTDDMEKSIQTILRLMIDLMRIMSISTMKM